MHKLSDEIGRNIVKSAEINRKDYIGNNLSRIRHICLEIKELQTQKLTLIERIDNENNVQGLVWRY